MPKFQINTGAKVHIPNALHRFLLNLPLDSSNDPNIIQGLAITLQCTEEQAKSCIAYACVCHVCKIEGLTWTAAAKEIELTDLEVEMLKLLGNKAAMAVCIAKNLDAAEFCNLLNKL